MDEDIVVTINTADGRVFEVDATKTLSRSYTANTSNDSNISIGYAAAQSFNISLDNLDKSWDSVLLRGGIIHPVIISGENKKPLGSFYIEKVEKVEGAINIESIDKMVDFDVKFGGGTFPMTLGYLVNLICEQVGINLATDNFTNSDFILKSGENIKGVSCRNILIQCCEMIGGYAVLNENDELELKWYDFKNINTTFTPDDMKTYKGEENQVEITGIKYERGEETFISGNDGFTLDINSNNPFLKESTADEIKVLLDNIYNAKLKNMSYLPCSFSADFNIDLNLGDVIGVTDLDNKETVSIVTSYKLSDNLNITIVAANKSKAEEQRYTQDIGSNSSTDTGDKIGYVVGRSTKGYEFTDGSQVITNCAINVLADTKVDTQLLMNYMVNKDAKMIFEYRVNGTVDMTFYQYAHLGMNTFSVAFIPVAMRKGTASIDLKATIDSGTATVEKHNAVISLLVKNGDVIETPPYPEINISQSFNPITINDKELISIANVNENIMLDTKRRLDSIFEEVLTSITIEDKTPIIVAGMNDNLVINEVIEGEAFKFNNENKGLYNYSIEHIKISNTDFREQQEYIYNGTEKNIDSGLLIEVPVLTDGFKQLNNVEVEVV